MDMLTLSFDDLETVMGLKPHFLIQTDGGCRNKGTTALGYVIYRVIFGYGCMPLEYYTLSMGGAKVAGNLSSFESEARALDLVLGKLVSYLATQDQ